MEISDLYNTKGHILVFAHADLDGAASAVLVRDAFDRTDVAAKRNGTRGREWARTKTRKKNRRRTVCRTINYGPLEQKAVKFIMKWHDRFDAVFFVDFSPLPETCRIMTDLDIHYFVIDHHQTAYVEHDNPLSRYYMDYKVSGAMGVYNVFRDRLGVSHKSLAYLADDYDMWRHTNYMSRHLNILYWNRYGFTGFLRWFSGGFRGIGRRVIKNVIRPYYDGLFAYMKSLCIRKLPDKGAYVELQEGNSYFGELSLILEKQFGWIVFATRTPDAIKLSFRSTLPDVNFGQALHAIGMGGGGHAKAAGQRLSPNADPMEFIEKVRAVILQANKDAFSK